MELRRAVLSLCLLGILAGATAKPKFVVFTTGLVKSAEPVKCCLLAKDHTQPMDVNVYIGVGEQNISIFNEQIPLGEIFKCSEFQVPEQNKASSLFIFVDATSGDFNYTKIQPVVIPPPGINVLIRTDKNRYKPGENARIYIIGIDNNLNPTEAKFSKISIKDPNGNPMQEWKDQSTNGEFLELNFPIIKDPTFGTYQIECQRTSGNTVWQTIVVEDYDVPKYSVEITAPPAVTVLDEDFSFAIFSEYTYKAPVPGRVSGTVCRPYSYYYSGDPCKRNPDGVCESFVGKLDAEGKYKGSVPLSVFQMERSGLGMYLRMKVTVIESDTNVQMTETKDISITRTMGQVLFDHKHTLPYYKQGLLYPVVIKVENGRGQPESNKTVQIQLNGMTVQNLTSDENGQARYEIDTSNMESTQFSIQAIYSSDPQCYDSNWVTPTYLNAYYTVYRFFTSTKTSLQLQGPLEEMKCGRTYNIKVSYVFGKDALEEGQTITKVNHMIVTKSRLVDGGEHFVDLSTSSKGEFNLALTVSPDYAPTVDIIAFTVTRTEMVADTMQFDLEKCFRNPVSLNFSAEMGTPGSYVDLEVKATPNSVCMARVIDSSLMILDKGRTLTAEMVYNSVQYTRPRGYSYEGFYVAPSEPPCIDSNEPILINGTYYQPVFMSQERDTSNLFSDIGLIAVTNTLYQQPRLCYSPSFSFGRPMAMESMVFADDAPRFDMPATEAVAADGASGPAEIVSVRTKFQDVWVFQKMITDGSGIASQSLEVPGTITTYKGDAICLSNTTGFGMTEKPTDFTAFQKMFVDINCASSMVQGETMRVIATVANYMGKSITVKLTLAPSPDYTVEENDSPVKCIGPQQRDSHSWNIKPTSLGLTNITVTAQTIHIGDSCDGPADPNEANRSDTIVKPLYVEPEGVKQDLTQSNFVCGYDVNPTVAFNITPSGNIVPGSLTAIMQVTGEIMGSALANPETLYTKPSGCGEQTASKLGPIPITTRYLNSTGGLTEDMLENAKVNMQIGVMNMMPFRNRDGSFSPFNNWKSEESSWLTLIVLTTFLSCRPFIPIDDTIIAQGIVYMARLQDPATGAFIPKGMVFNTQLKGAADDTLGFTCMVVRFFMQSTHPSTPILRRNTLSYLEAAAQKNQSLYNTILMWDTFNVAGNKELANTMAQKAFSMAIDDGRTIHWESPLKLKSQTPSMFASEENAGSIEMTAIALRALLYGESRSSLSGEKGNNASKIALYLAQNQKQQGGYTSTRDTVETLNSLAIYGELTHVENATNTVYLKKGDAVIREFSLDPSNRQFPQIEPLTDVPGEYIVEVQGNACVLLQAGVKVNVPFKRENLAFLLSVTTSPNDCKDGVASTFVAQFNVSYEGMQNKSQMALLDIALPSGHAVEHDSLKQLKSIFPKLELKNNHCIIYFYSVDSKGYSFDMKLERRTFVSNFQDKLAVIYHYYASEENAYALLKHPCTLKSDEKF